MVMPYEAELATFFIDSTKENQQWKKEIYSSLLPSSWKEYDGIYESFYAGAMGRSVIIMHGTTINPQYYTNQSYYPQTPSLGCLCSYEEWSKDGKLIESNQQAIVEALKSIGGKNGYVIVINMDNQKKLLAVKKLLLSLTKNLRALAHFIIQFIIYSDFYSACPFL